MSLWLSILLAQRPLLVTVDDLPIASQLTDPIDRQRTTRALLDALDRHRIRAVGLVTAERIRGPDDEALLLEWIDRGHELGNHSSGHLDLTTTPIDAYVADVEKGRARLAAILARREKALRFFRFPFLREGDTPEKLDALRAYLAKSGQRNLPVTIDTQDWSFDAEWIAGKGRDEVGRRYQASLRMAVDHYAALGSKVIGRDVPEILLLHGNAVGAAQWDALFTWIESRGFRFAPADEVLADPAYAIEHRFTGPRGFSLWDRIRVEREDAAARKAIADLLTRQAADWTRGDVTAFCAVYAEDATFISPSGLTQGRQAIIDRYRKKYPTKERMGTLELAVIETRLFRGWEVSRSGDAVPSRIHGASTILRWTIRYEGKEPLAGLSMVTLVPSSGSYVITQDASM
jgi:peptidoglycan/xylan/chitin deacetylase (PgdA/CDA1 family)